MATMEQLETALINAHEAGDEEAARILAAEILRVRGAHAEETPPPPVSRTESVGRGFMAPLEDLSLDIYRGIGRGLEALGFPAAQGLEGLDVAQQRIEQARVPAQQQRPNYFTGGQIAGEVFVTAPLISTGGAGVARLGAGLGRFAPTAGRSVQQFGRAVQTGGVGVRAPTMANRAAIARGAPVAASRGGRMALRVGGGATAGAGGAVLTDQDLVTSTIGGGGIPIIGTIARRGAGATFDALAMRVGTTRAAEVFRNLIAERSTEIMQALANAPRNVRANTAQFLAERGLLTPELASATRIAEASNWGKPLERAALARAAAREESLSTLRGGATQAEAVENINAMRRGVQQTAEPLRQKAMNETNVGRTQIVPLENLAAALDDAARQLNEAGQVRRMRRLEGRTEEQIQDVFAHPELYSPSTSGRMLPRLGEVADQAGQRADEGIDLQMFLRDEAALARGVADDLRAQGYAPLDIRPVVSRMRQLAAAALPNTGRRLLFSRFADMLEQAAAESGGIIDGVQLHLAKRELGDFVANVLGQADPSAIQRGTAMMAGDVQSAIDEAFNAAAPGSPMAEYNRVFSEGMRRVEQQDFARRLTQLPSPRFDRLMAGNDPDLVSRLFPGEFDINAILSPAQQQTARQLQRQVAADLDVSNLGLRAIPRENRGGLRQGAENRVVESLEPGMSPIARGFYNVVGRVPGISGGGIAAEQAARAYSQAMAANAMRRLVPALADPAAAFRLAQQRSTNAMLRGVIDRVGIPGFAAGTQTAQQIVAGQPVYEEPADTGAGGVYVSFPNLDNAASAPIEWDGRQWVPVD